MHTLVCASPRLNSQLIGDLNMMHCHQLEELSRLQGAAQELVMKCQKCNEVSSILSDKIAKAHAGMRSLTDE